MVGSTLLLLPSAFLQTGIYMSSALTIGIGPVPCIALCFRHGGGFRFTPEWCLGCRWNHHPVTCTKPGSAGVTMFQRVCVCLSTSAPVIRSGSVFVRLHLHALVSLAKGHSGGGGFDGMQ